MSASNVFDLTSVLSLAGVTALGVAAYAGNRILLPKNASANDRFTFVWLTCDALIHLIFNASLVYHSTFGRTVNTSSGPFVVMFKDYAAADLRYGNADSTMVSLKILTAFGAGPICCLILSQLLKQDPARHFWVVILCTGEIYGTWMTFAPEWLTQSPNLDTSNSFYMFLFLSNLLWIFIPLWLLWNSYGAIAKSLRSAVKAKTA